jgi:hypothetical protein
LGEFFSDLMYAIFDFFELLVGDVCITFFVLTHQAFVDTDETGEC